MRFGGAGGTGVRFVCGPVRREGEESAGLELVITAAGLVLVTAKLFKVKGRYGLVPSGKGEEVRRGLLRTSPSY